MAMSFMAILAAAMVRPLKNVVSSVCHHLLLFSVATRGTHGESHELLKQAGDD